MPRNLTYFVSDVHLGLQVAGPADREARFTAFLAAFASGLFACKVMIALVKKAKLTWFALYCLLVAVLIFILA